MTPTLSIASAAAALLPAVLMLAAALPLGRDDPRAAWRRLRWLAPAALAAALVHLGAQLAGAAPTLPAGLAATPAGAGVAVLVQLLGTVIAAFSARYLHGEPGQPRYVASLAAVLAAVHLLLLAGHWAVLIAAWAAAGVALQRLLCFYPDRPFARLAAHKKRVADRLADVLLLAAAGLAWSVVGSGRFDDLERHLAAAGAPSAALQASALCLALAVVLRTGLLPVHGWLMQVMEAPTPVSALLHAGVVNLGGFVLIRLSPLLEAVPAARWLLVGAGLATAVLAGFVMLTRVSIKLRLAWSTAAQMGFMVMECGLGLYTLALLHLVGHSLYKAHAFLGASGAVEATRRRLMQEPAAPSPLALALAPPAAAAIVAALVAAAAALAPLQAWPAWWSGVLAFAWAPLLWWPAARGRDDAGALRHAARGAGMVALLAAAALAGHALPFGLHDAALDAAGHVALAGMALLYAGIALLLVRPAALAAWRRWSYAGFYVDEVVTRAVLRLWPVRWMPARAA